jgi:hypothetical protein
MVIRILPDAFIVFDTNSGTRKKMRPSQIEKQKFVKVATPKIFAPPLTLDTALDTYQFCRRYD